MSVEEISEGLKLAISKGESLKQAMETFYSAGYSRVEVQQASASFSPQAQQNQQHQLTQPVNPITSPLKSSTIRPMQKPKASVSETQQDKKGLHSLDLPQSQQQTVQPDQILQASDVQVQSQVKTSTPAPMTNNSQIVSNYGDSQKVETRKNPRDFLIIAISVLLFVFGGIILGIVLFRENIINFINNLIG